MNRTRAFTLIELLICVGVILVIAGVTHELFAGQARTHSHFADRVHVQTRAAAATEMWRRDIGVATSVTRSGDGLSATIRQATADGAGRQVEYAFANGRLTRRTAESEPAQVLSENVVAPSIVEQAGTWRLSWTTADYDGVRTMIRPHGAVAVPLVGAREAAQ